METPWGMLKDLDLSSHDLAARVLEADKHQLIEGLVVECLFDQICNNIPPVFEKPVIALDVDTVVVDTGREYERWIVLVLARTKAKGLGRYLMALEKGLVPYLVTFEKGEFWASRIENGKRAHPERLLTDIMDELARGKKRPFVVNDLVKDHDRQRQAFWGFLSNYHGSSLGEKIVLPRIFINYAIQPYFRSVWNIDRVFVVDNQVWIFEIKHKFPIDKQNLYFGINNGELKMLEKLTSTGIKCIHTILVKPYWSKDVGSMYLLTKLDMLARAAIIACVLDKKSLTTLMNKQSAISGAHTSITGVSAQQYKNIPAGKFSRLGFLSEAKKVAEQLSILMADNQLPGVDDAWLRGLQAVE